MSGDFGLVLGMGAALAAGLLFYGAAPRQRLLTRSLSGALGVGVGTALTLLAALCLAQEMSLTTAVFLTVLLLMLVCCLLPVTVALLNPQGGQR